MKVHSSLKEWMDTRDTLRGKSIGFVPTMGALHAGHFSLLERARRENDIVLLSLFVNPTQFDDPSDFQKYPKTLDADLAMAEAAGCDHVIQPGADQMYPDQYRYKVSESEFSKRLCGAHRPGHFDGVLTVVLKLFHIASPTRAYFGEKDFQQLELIRGMVDAFYMPIEIVPCPIVREADGLAMSSRNVRLSSEERRRAPQFHKILSSSPSTAVAIEQLIKQGFEIDYIEEIAGRRYGAIRLGSVRLIDNVEVQA